MQLGTRWAFGAEPPTRLPDAVVAAIAEVEQAASDASKGSDASARRWTLTWLEGRPIVELDPAHGSEDVTVIRFNPSSGAATIAAGDSGEEWVEEEL
ncbi:hypothetical protein GCM10022239_16630 [Leifsonia bigeumensis]|uniref:Fe-S oxidoreductase n=1 Tax=Leifsonella bigeumensis TaxID=433643 RepID=A0ABP7FJX3_9MICO